MLRVLLLSCFCLYLTNGYAESTREVLIAGDDWCPVNCGRDDPQQGYMIDVARIAFADAGYTVRYIEVPWVRAVSMAKSGEIHGIVGAFHGDAPDFVFPDEALLNMSSSSLFTRIEADWSYGGMASLEQVKLGVVKGYDYGEVLNDYILDYSRSPARVSILAGDNSAERSIKQLLRGRLDVVAESAPVFWYTAKKLKVTQLLRAAGVVSDPEPCYIAFSPNKKESADLAKVLDLGVKRMRKKGKMVMLGKAYGLPDSVLTSKVSQPE